jgi:hypothetical protein
MGGPPPASDIAPRTDEPGAKAMRLRICDGEFERIVPASRELLEEAFGPTTAAAPGTEITLAEDGRWLSATVLALTERAVYLMAGGPGLGVIVMGRTAWDDARQQFQDFLAGEAAHAHC